MIARVSLFVLAPNGDNKSRKEKSTLSFSLSSPDSSSFHLSVGAKLLPKKMTLFSKRPSMVCFLSGSLFIHRSSIRLFSCVLEVQTEGTKVAGGVVGVHHRRRRDGDEELVAGPQLEKSTLVDGV